jgi:hypothetical protein
LWCNIKVHYSQPAYRKIHFIDLIKLIHLSMWMETR